MAAELFRNFLQDPRTYEQAQRFWLDLWKDTLASAGIASDWQAPWFSDRFEDGTPARDGNPIFSAVSRGQRRSVRIIQHEATQTEPELMWWLDSLADQIGEISELVISCAASDEVVHLIRRLIFAWVVAGSIRLDLSPGLLPNISPVGREATLQIAA